MKLYLAITQDKYELPLVVETRLDALSEKTGVKKSYIQMCLSRGYRTNKATKVGMKFISVEVEK